MSPSTKYWKAPDYIPTLDGWRAVAILLVLFCHAGSHLFGPHGIWPSEAGLKLASHGIIGVDVFFALSGFLITSKLAAEYRRKGKVDLLAFYRRRTFRILPAYWTYLAAIGAAAAAGIIVLQPKEIWSCLLFWRNYSEAFSLYTGHFWSLAVEEHFYLLWPATLALTGARRAAVVAAVAALGVHFWRAADSRFFLFDGWLPGTITLHRTDTRLDALLWGAAAALWFHPIQAFLVARARQVSNVLPFLLTGALVGGIAIAFPMQPLWKAILLPALLLSTVVFHQGPAARFLELAPMRWVGRLSYSLYLWHAAYLIYLHPDSSAMHPAASLLLAVLLSFASASFSYYVVEQPCIALGAKLGRAGKRSSDPGLGAAASTGS